MKIAPNIEQMSNTPLKLVEKSIVKLILVKNKEKWHHYRENVVYSLEPSHIPYEP